VLGGFTVGEFAKVGSNAVVVKPVPAGATAVGNPAHIIRKEEQSRSVRAVFRLWRHAERRRSAVEGLARPDRPRGARQDEQLERLTATIKAAGIACPNVPG
jgi:serine O-acetyltransferase